MQRKLAQSFSLDEQFKNMLSYQFKSMLLSSNVACLPTQLGVVNEVGQVGLRLLAVQRDHWLYCQFT